MQNRTQKVVKSLWSDDCLVHSTIRGQLLYYLYGSVARLGSRRANHLQHFTRQLYSWIVLHVQTQGHRNRVYLVKRVLANASTAQMAYNLRIRLTALKFLAPKILTD